MPNNIFISHVSEEAETALRIKLALEADFLGLVEIFVSSDAQSIAAGEQWLSSIDAALRDASILLILCSPDSITRPWINFEAGAAWMRQIPLIPVCHGGLSAGDLPMPLSLRQGIELNNADGLQRLYTRVASVLHCRVPNRSFDELAHTLSGRAVNRGLDDDADIRDRLNKALNHPRHRWRTLRRLASAAAVSEDAAARLLRGDSTVRFSNNEAGEVIVGLISRVGNG